jgi:glycolate oxidase FAD binding subunit
VKNVSGYDLNKLFIGSYGTLGLITRVTIRLRPNDEARAEWSATYALWSEAEAVARKILDGDYVPALLRVEAGDGVLHLNARFDGSKAAVASQIASLPESDSTSQQTAKKEKVLNLRAHLPYSRAAAWAQSAQTAGADSITWDCGQGVIRAGFSSLPENAVQLVESLRAQAEKQEGFLIVLRAPDELKTNDFVWGKPRGDGDLQKKLKETFDAANVCGPGRLVG